MLRAELKQKLLEKDKILAKKINGPPKKELITADDFFDLADEITIFVRKAVRGATELIADIWKQPRKPNTKFIVDENTPIISGATLWRYFGYDKKYVLKNEDHETHVRCVKFILLYLGIDHEEWVYYLKVPGQHQIRLSKLVNCWYVYRFDHSLRVPKVKRTLLKITGEEEHHLKAQFVTLENVYETELIRKKDNVVTISFDTGEKTIDLVISLGNNALNAVSPALNGLLHSVGAGPTSKHCVIVCTDKPGLQAVAGEITNVCHSTETEADAISGPATDPIVAYLYRKSNWLRAIPFDPANIYEIQERNENFFGRDNNYSSLKDILTENWVSIASVDYREDKLSINSFRFVFNDSLKTCKFICNRMDFNQNAIEITGTVIYKNNWIILNSRQHEPVTFNSIMRGTLTQLFASSALVDASGNFVIREILLAADKSSLLVYGKCRQIFYDELVKNEQIKNPEKRFLFDKKPDFSQWRSAHLQDNRSHELSVYADRWLVLMPNTYAKNNSLLQITLEIDLVAGSREKSIIVVGEREIHYKYRGHASILGDTLRLSNLENSTHKSEYFFDIKHGQAYPVCLEGLNVGRDAKGFVCSNYCIAVRYKTKFGRFEPCVLESNSVNYKNIESYVADEIQVPLQNYFFVKYPSFRR
jgi:hypothetical protein